MVKVARAKSIISNDYPAANRKWLKVATSNAFDILKS